jgi:hypothetical protein
MLCEVVMDVSEVGALPLSLPVYKRRGIAASAAGLALLFSLVTLWSVGRQSEGRDLHSGAHPVVERVVPLTGIAELDQLRHLDAHWYLDIAVHGYRLDAGQSNVVFFPLLPLLVRGTSVVTGLPVGTAGEAVVLVFTVLASILVAFHARELFERGGSPTPTWLPMLVVAALLLHPMSVFLYAIYPESLFITLCTALLLCLRRERTIWAAVLAFLLALTRPQGLFVPVALVASDLIDSTRAGRPRVSRATIGCCVATVCAVALFAWHLQLATGDAWSFWTRRSDWDAHQSLANIPRLLAPIITKQFFVTKMLMYITLAGVALLWRRGETVAACVSALFVVLPLYKGDLGDVMRYSLLAVYAYAPLCQAAARLPALMIGGLGLTACMHGVFFVRFLQGRWVG